MLVILDYGVGNLGSLLNMCNRLGINAIISSNSNDIINATHIILPGVGSFDSGINKFNKSCLLKPLEEAVFEKKIPILGICLGMQLMCKSSEEGTLSGFGWIDATALRINFSDKLKVPHIGWNSIECLKKNSLFDEDLDYRFYFVHSYYVKCANKENILCSTLYEKEFTSGFQDENIFGVQFHPEKSHKFGMSLLKNFSKLGI